MKITIYFKALCFILLLLTSCSEDDNEVIPEEFLSAQVNESTFSVNEQNGVLSAQKQLSSYGTVNLLVSGKTSEGKTIEFLVLYYGGEKSYVIGNNPSVAQGSINNQNWCKYSEDNPREHWSTINDFFYTGGLSNYVEITTDDGSYIEGNFSFEGHNSAGNSSRQISEGNFRLKLR